VVAAPLIIMSTIAERTRGVCALLQRVVAQTLAQNHVDYLQGTARLGPNRTLEVTTASGTLETLAADVILIATGSRPFRPPNIPFEDPDVCDSDEIFKLGRIPKNIFIVGGGAVGVEFATIFAALGASVTLSDKSDRLLTMMDGEISRLMAKHLMHVGVRVIESSGRPRTSVLEMEASP